jgi:uncharacterized protein (TIGR02466 family)
MRVKEAAEINPGIRKIILENEAACPSLSRSNVGGRHSSDDILEWPGADLKILRESIRDAAVHMTKLMLGSDAFEGRLILTAWANVLRHGGYHQPHTHAQHHWSGVYYVDAGWPDPDWPKSGKFALQDPRERAEMSGTPGNPFGQTMTIPTEAGMMIVFPSWLIHWVNPFYGEGERISISFNARIDRPKISKHSAA